MENLFETTSNYELSGYNCLTANATVLSAILLSLSELLATNRRIKSMKIRTGRSALIHDHDDEPSNYNEMNNSTLAIDEKTLHRLNETSVLAADTYEYDEALLYIVFIFLVYSMFVVALIRIQVKKSDLHYYEDSDDPSDTTAHNLLKRIRTEDTKRKALVDLSNLAFRRKLWEIYLENPNKYKMIRTETKRIQQIDKKLKSYYTNEKDHNKTIDLTSSNAPKNWNSYATVSRRNENTYSLVKPQNMSSYQQQQQQQTLQQLQPLQQQQSYYATVGRSDSISTKSTQPWYMPESPTSTITGTASKNINFNKYFNSPRPNPSDSTDSPITPQDSPSRFKVEKIADASPINTAESTLVAHGIV